MSKWRQWRHTPGSAGAVEAGCTCAVIDNHHGAGRYGSGEKYGWFVSGDCLLHGASPAPPEDTAE